MLSLNIKLFCTRCETGSRLAFLPVSKARTNKLYIFRQYIRTVYCIFIPLCDNILPTLSQLKISLHIRKRKTILFLKCLHQQKFKIHVIKRIATFAFRIKNKSLFTEHDNSSIMRKHALEKYCKVRLLMIYFLYSESKNSYTIIYATFCLHNFNEESVSSTLAY